MGVVGAAPRGRVQRRKRFHMAGSPRHWVDQAAKAYEKNPKVFRLMFFLIFVALLGLSVAFRTALSMLPSSVQIELPTSEEEVAQELEEAQARAAQLLKELGEIGDDSELAELMKEGLDLPAGGAGNIDVDTLLSEQVKVLEMLRAAGGHAEDAAGSSEDTELDEELHKLEVAAATLLGSDAEDANGQAEGSQEESQPDEERVRPAYVEEAGKIAGVVMDEVLTQLVESDVHAELAEMKSRLELEAEEAAQKKRLQHQHNVEILSHHLPKGVMPAAQLERLRGAERVKGLKSR